MSVVRSDPVGVPSLSGRIYCLPFEEETMKKWSTALAALGMSGALGGAIGRGAAGHQRPISGRTASARRTPTWGSN